MAGGRTNTQRIEDLESLTANLSARLDVHDFALKNLTDLLTRAEQSVSAATVRLAVVDVQVTDIGTLKVAIENLRGLEMELALLRKDVEGLKSWKEDVKKERDEASRRRWAFGPNVVAAIISGIISLGIALLVVSLNKSK